MSHTLVVDARLPVEFGSRPIRVEIPNDGVNGYGEPVVWLGNLRLDPAVLTVADDEDEDEA